jgi:quercetin dioxygenase-like cupin family protein
MNLSAYHATDKEVSTKLIFTGEGKVIALRIKKGAKLEEHITTIPAYLVCVSGKAIFENEFGFKKRMYDGETIQIEPNVKHWVVAETDSDFLLIK